MVGPQFPEPVSSLDPLADVISSLNPALGLGIPTKASPNTEGTMALYLAEGGDSDRFLGPSCHYVLIGSEEVDIDYVHRSSKHPKDVVLLGREAFTNLVNSIKGQSKLSTGRRRTNSMRRGKGY